MENLTVGARGTSVYVCCMDVRTRDANDIQGYIRGLSDPSRVELIYDSVRKYASTRAVGVRRSQPVIPIPLNRSGSPRKPMSQRCSLFSVHIYISALCRNTSKGAAAPPPARRPEVWSSKSRACRARERRAEKVSDETGDVQIDESDVREGKEERGLCWRNDVKYRRNKISITDIDSLKLKRNSTINPHRY